MLSFLRDWVESHVMDDMIDTYISERGCKSYRPGMDKPDTNILNRNGQRRWAEVRTAQARLHPLAGKVIRLVRSSD